MVFSLSNSLSRKHKIWCDNKDIEIPGGKIEGPNMELENKEFIAVLTINNKEKVSHLAALSQCSHLIFPAQVEMSPPPHRGGRGGELRLVPAAG